MREIIMGYQGEMSLKGLNRNQFEIGRASCRERV